MSSRQERVLLDLNNPVFQQDLFSLEAVQQHVVLGTLRRISQMSWDQVYRDRGLRWELIVSRLGPQGGRIYSLRISRGFRATAYRDGAWLRLLSLHPDHDSAYSG